MECFYRLLKHKSGWHFFNNQHIFLINNLNKVLLKVYLTCYYDLIKRQIINKKTRVVLNIRDAERTLVYLWYLIISNQLMSSLIRKRFTLNEWFTNWSNFKLSSTHLRVNQFIIILNNKCLFSFKYVILLHIGVYEVTF